MRYRSCKSSCTTVTTAIIPSCNRLLLHHLRYSSRPKDGPWSSLRKTRLCISSAMSGPRTVPWLSDFCVGLGVSSFTGEAAYKPWAFCDDARPQLNSQLDIEGVHPRTIHFEEGFLDSNVHHHYEKALKAAASLNVMSWGASAQSSVELLSDMKLDSRTQNYVVVARFETCSKNIIASSTYQPALSQRALAELQERGPTWWARQYGTHFVAGYVVGGHMVGTASISSQSIQRTSEVRVMLEAKFGYGWLSGGAGASFNRADNKAFDGCQVKTRYTCSGASMLEIDTSDIFALRKAAQEHVQKGVGLKAEAILWPFSHLESYNEAAAAYSGPEQQFLWQHNALEHLSALNMEHARLQRVDKNLAARRDTADADASAYQAISSKVKAAFRALGSIQTWEDLAKVDDTHADYEVDLYRTIFVSHEAEAVLLEALLLPTGALPAVSAWLRSLQAQQAAADILHLATTAFDKRPFAPEVMSVLGTLLSSDLPAVHEVAAATVCKLLEIAGDQEERELIAANSVPALSALLKLVQPPVQHLILQPFVSLASCLKGTCGSMFSDIVAAVVFVVKAEQPLTQKDAVLGLLQLVKHHEAYGKSPSMMVMDSSLLAFLLAFLRPRRDRRRDQDYRQSSQHLRDVIADAVPSVARCLQASEAQALLHIIGFIREGSNQGGLMQAVPAVVELLDQPSYQQIAVDAIFTMSTCRDSAINRCFVAAGALPKLRQLATNVSGAQFVIDTLLFRSFNR